jgi:hypothetical protein
MTPWGTPPLEPRSAGALKCCIWKWDKRALSLHEAAGELGEKEAGRCAEEAWEWYDDYKVGKYTVLAGYMEGEPGVQRSRSPFLCVSGT